MKEKAFSDHSTYRSGRPVVVEASQAARCSNERPILDRESGRGLLCLGVLAWFGPLAFLSVRLPFGMLLLRMLTRQPPLKLLDLVLDFLPAIVGGKENVVRVG